LFIDWHQAAAQQKPPWIGRWATEPKQCEEEPRDEQPAGPLIITGGTLTEHEAGICKVLKFDVESTTDKDHRAAHHIADVVSDDIGLLDSELVEDGDEVASLGNFLVQPSGCEGRPMPRRSGTTTVSGSSGDNKSYITYVRIE
jgi:hypothetical protein